MKRREFIKATSKCALLCASPVILSTLQSCEDVEANNYSPETNPPIDNPTDGGSTSGGTTGGGSTGGTDGGSSTPYVSFDLSNADMQALQTVGNSIATPSNTADPSGLILYRADSANVRAFTRTCTHSGGSVGSFVNGTATCGSHGAQFNTSGSVVGGPARSSLKEYRTSLDGNMLKVFYNE